MTLAPQSASWRTAVGPARACVRSSTVKRDSGKVPMLTMAFLPFRKSCRTFVRGMRQRQEIRGLPGWVLFAQQRREPSREALGLLDFGMMAGFLDHLEAGARDQPLIGETEIRGDDPVAAAPQHQRRNPDAAEPLLQLRVIEAGVPCIETYRLEIAGVNDQFFVAHRIVIGRIGRIVPAAAPEFGRVDVEYVK